MPDVLDEYSEEILPALQAPLEGRIQLSPYNFRFTGEDALRLTIHNSAGSAVADDFPVVAVHYRMARPSGEIVPAALSVTASLSLLGDEFEFEIGDGYLLNIVAFVSDNSPRLGQTFIRVDVIRGRGAAAIVLGTLLQDYTNEHNAVAWPGSPIRSSLEGNGYVTFVEGSDPAAGAEVFEQVPSGRRWQLLTLRVALTTDATAANRRPQLVLTVSGGELIKIPAPAVVAASGSEVFCWGSGVDSAGTVVATAPLAGLPRGVTFGQGDQIGTATASLQSGDNYGAPRLAVREWLEVR